jgi:hypothetical protein
MPLFLSVDAAFIKEFHLL